LGIYEIAHSKNADKPKDPGCAFDEKFTPGIFGFMFTIFRRYNGHWSHFFPGGFFALRYIF
jgi:hypothetical protein